MGKQYSDEIAYIPRAIAWAINENIDLLTRSLLNLSGLNLSCIGSGGSTTAAAYVAMLHENHRGMLSKSCTPGEFLIHQHASRNAGSILISAEGKNMDILAAAERLEFFEIPSLAIVLRPETPLSIKCRTNGITSVVSFDMPWQKDGYLATNSLIAMMILMARAYGEEKLITGLSEIDHGWIQRRQKSLIEQNIIEHFSARKTFSILHGLVGNIGAMDIESKLAESAFGTCEKTDYRQFAHGRHLRLLNPSESPCFLAISSTKDRDLCESTLSLFPKSIPVVRLDLPDDSALGNVISVIDSILITGILGAAFNKDPGQPKVTTLGRSIHSLDVNRLLPQPASLPIAIERKLHGNIADVETNSVWKSKCRDFIQRLGDAKIRAVVCDFDGTFCDTERRYEGLDERLVPMIERIVNSGIILGFGTGRGDSLYNDLRKKLSSDIWPKIVVGYYSGSIINSLDLDLFDEPKHDARFGDLEDWLKVNAIISNASISIKKCGGQMSIRMKNMSLMPKVLESTRYWVEEQSLVGWRVFCSGHSIDVITKSTGKNSVVQEISQRANANPFTEVLRIGDSGHIGGNDFELLSEGLGLSVDKVSPFADSCWNLLPRGRKGVAGTMCYLNSLVETQGGLKFSPNFLDFTELFFTEKEGFL